MSILGGLRDLRERGKSEQDVVLELRYRTRGP